MIKERNNETFISAKSLAESGQYGIIDFVINVKRGDRISLLGHRYYTLDVKTAKLIEISKSHYNKLKEYITSTKYYHYNGKRFSRQYSKKKPDNFIKSDIGSPITFQDATLPPEQYVNTFKDIIYNNLSDVMIPAINQMQIPVINYNFTLELSNDVYVEKRLGVQISSVNSSRNLADDITSSKKVVKKELTEKDIMEYLAQAFENMNDFR